MLAARIGYLLTAIPGGSAAGFPSVMTQYCSAYHNDMAEAGLFGPAVPTVSEARSMSPAVEGTSLDGTHTEHWSPGQVPPRPCAATLLSHAFRERGGHGRRSQCDRSCCPGSRLGRKLQISDMSPLDDQGGGYGRQKPTSPENA